MSLFERKDGIHGPHRRDTATEAVFADLVRFGVKMTNSIISGGSKIGPAEVRDLGSCGSAMRSANCHAKKGYRFLLETGDPRNAKAMLLAGKELESRRSVPTPRIKEDCDISEINKALGQDYVTVWKFVGRVSQRGFNHRSRLILPYGAGYETAYQLELDAA